MKFRTKETHNEHCDLELIEGFKKSLKDLKAGRYEEF
jgi:hypothetical protein